MCDQNSADKWLTQECLIQAPQKVIRFSQKYPIAASTSNPDAPPISTDLHPLDYRQALLAVSSVLG